MICADFRKGEEKTSNCVDENYNNKFSQEETREILAKLIEEIGHLSTPKNLG